MTSMIEQNVISDVRVKLYGHMERIDKMGYLTSMYRHLFSLLTPDAFEWQINHTYEISRGLDDYFVGRDGKENWFYIFHKNIRQTDFFDDCIKHESIDMLTDEEKKEMKYLRHKYVIEKTEEKRDDKGFVDGYKRYLSLHERWRRRIHERNIGGHLDMLLWNLIQIDNGLLQKSLEHLFLDMDQEKS